MAVCVSIPALYVGITGKDWKLTTALNKTVLEGDVMPLNLKLPETDLNNID